MVVAEALLRRRPTARIRDVPLVPSVEILILPQQPKRKPDPQVAKRREQERAAVYLTAFIRKLRPPWQRKIKPNPEGDHKRYVRALMRFVIAIRPKARRGRPPDPEIRRRRVAAEALANLVRNLSLPTIEAHDLLVLEGNWSFGGLSLVAALALAGTPVGEVRFCRGENEVPSIFRGSRKPRKPKLPTTRIRRGTVHRPRAPRKGVWSAFTGKRHSYVASSVSFNPSLSPEIVMPPPRKVVAAVIVVHKLCTEGGAAHHWLIETPHGPDEGETAKCAAVCKNCAAAREFATVDL